MVSDDDLEAAARLLEARCGLDALWLFGSAAVGREGPASDLDLAVLVSTLPVPAERLALREDLASMLQRPVDLVFLDDASPVVAMQVLAKGRLVINRNPLRQAELVVRTITAYADLKHARAGVEQAIRERFGNG